MNMLVENLWTPVNRLIFYEEKAFQRIWNQIKVQIEEGKLCTVEHVVEALKPYPEQEVINRIVVTVFLEQRRFKDAVQILRRYPVGLETNTTSLLHMAVAFNSIRVVKILLLKGANFLYRDRYSAIPIDRAKENSSVKTLLLKKHRIFNHLFNQLVGFEINNHTFDKESAEYILRYAMKFQPGMMATKEKVPNTDFRLSYQDGQAFLYDNSEPMVIICFKEEKLLPFIISPDLVQRGVASKFCAKSNC